MNKHTTGNNEEVKVKAYENGVYLSYVSVLKYLGQIVLILTTGFGIYLTLKFNYVHEKISNNKSEIERLDREKVDWKDYDRWIKLPKTVDKTKYIQGLVTENKKGNRNEKTR